MDAATGKPGSDTAVESSDMSEASDDNSDGAGAGVSCDLCDLALPLHASYLVRIDVMADPSLPPMSGEELASFNFEKALTEIADEASAMTADELQDGVYRRFEYRLCPMCQRRFLANPLGKPRDGRPGKN